MKIPTFIRIKGAGACVTELDINRIHAFNIVDSEEGEYCLTALTDGAVYIIKSGTFDTCHFSLNQLNAILGINIIDT